MLKTTPERALEAIKKSGGCRDIVLTGGEPTTLISLPSIAAACKAAGVKRIGMVTNGRTLSCPGYLKELVSSGINSITISLYSHLPEIHDRLTSTKGSCVQTWKGLSNVTGLTRTGSISSQVNIVLCAENIRTAGTTLRMLKILGTDSVTLINLAGSATNIFNYSKIRVLLRELAQRRAAYPDRIVFRGFPLCIFHNGFTAETQDIGGAGGVSRTRLILYARIFKKQFIKPPELCRRCSKTSRCNGVSSAYFKRYALSGLQ